jgi:hypothetical protein
MHTQRLAVQGRVHTPRLEETKVHMRALPEHTRVHTQQLLEQSRVHM